MLLFSRHKKSYEPQSIKLITGNIMSDEYQMKKHSLYAHTIHTTNRHFRRTRTFQYLKLLQMSSKIVLCVTMEGAMLPRAGAPFGPFLHLPVNTNRTGPIHYTGCK